MEHCQLPNIEITASTSGNFIAFNKMDEDLDSEWLMQPVLEAQYDSETQCCVDGSSGGPSSFADHFVTKRKKLRKKGKLNEGDADPTLRHLRQNVPQRPLILCGNVAQSNVIHTHDMLCIPGSMYDPTAIPQGSLRNPATRRIATGAAPPGFCRQCPPIEVAGDAPPSYEEATGRSIPTPTKRKFSGTGLSPNL